MKKRILSTAILICSFVFVNASDQKYSIGEKISFKSTILDEERNIIVYTPLNYGFNDQRFPVMYLLDGGTHFHHVSGIVQFLSSQGLMPEMIVVAVMNVDRTRDFSPTHDKRYPSSGGAENFIGFIQDELIPFVNRNYKTEPYNLLVGHSFGGTFATFCLADHPDVFDGYIAISPFLHYDESSVLDDVDKNLKSSFKRNKQFYMTVGNEPEYFKPLDRFVKYIDLRSPRNLEFTYVKMLDDDHGSVPHMSIYNGLLWIFSGWNVDQDQFDDGLAYLDGHAKKLSKKYGYKIETPELTINRLGYYFFGKKQFNEAIEIFAENVRRFPKSANVYDSLGEVYERTEQFDNAISNYEKAVEIATKIHHPNLKIYSDNLKRAQKKVAQM